MVRIFPSVLLIFIQSFLDPVCIGNNLNKLFEEGRFCSITVCARVVRRIVEVRKFNRARIFVS